MNKSERLVFNFLSKMDFFVCFISQTNWDRAKIFRKTFNQRFPFVKLIFPDLNRIPAFKRPDFVCTRMYKSKNTSIYVDAKARLSDRNGCIIAQFTQAELIGLYGLYDVTGVEIWVAFTFPEKLIKEGNEKIAMMHIADLQCLLPQEAYLLDIEEFNGSRDCELVIAGEIHKGYEFIVKEKFIVDGTFDVDAMFDRRIKDEPLSLEGDWSDVWEKFDQ